jgi:cytochrome b6-f complex iron-sulfur subunit
MAHSNSLQVERLNRREFLYYALGGSIILAAGSATAGLLRYMMPIDPTRHMILNANDLPTWGSPRLIASNNFAAKFYYVQTDDTLLMLDWHCTQWWGECNVKWVDTNYRFECPCCGSKFEINGTPIEGPAPRSLDRYFTQITFTDGTTATSNDAGDPIPLAGREIARVVVDTKRLIPGPPRKSGV